MAIPVFWRIILGYSIILVASVALSLYSIVQLGTLSDTVTTTLNVDNRMLASQEKLADAILSEVRYGNKFVITHVSTLLDQFREFRKDSTDYLDELNTLAHSATSTARLARVQEYHLRYHDLFDQETRFATARQTYAESRYREEKEKLIERILAELQSLKEELQKDVHRKLQSIEKAARLTRTITILMTVVLLGIGVALSFAISKSITQPLSQMRQMTAAGPAASFEGAFDFSHIPEIQELADELNKTRRQLHTAARIDSQFCSSMTEQFAKPLVSICERLQHLKVELGDVTTIEQRNTLELLIEESGRLIRLARQLPESSGGTGEPTALKGSEPLRSLTKKGLNLALRQRWMSELVYRMRQKNKLLVGSALSRLAAAWHTVKDSITSLGWGKEKK